MILEWLVATALAKDLTINDQDQVAVQQICDNAALNPNVNREVRAAIAGWCVAWDARVKKNNEPEKPVETEKSK